MLDVVGEFVDDGGGGGDGRVVGSDPFLESLYFPARPPVEAHASAVADEDPLLPVEVPRLYVASGGLPGDVGEVHIWVVLGVASATIWGRSSLISFVALGRKRISGVSMSGCPLGSVFSGESENDYPAGGFVFHDVEVEVCGLEAFQFLCVFCGFGQVEVGLDDRFPVEFAPVCHLGESYDPDLPDAYSFEVLRPAPFVGGLSFQGVSFFPEGPGEFFVVHVVIGWVSLLLLDCLGGGFDLGSVLEHVARGDGGEFFPVDHAGLDRNDLGDRAVGAGVSEGQMGASEVGCGLQALPDVPTDLPSLLGPFLCLSSLAPSYRLSSSMITSGVMISGSWTTFRPALMRRTPGIRRSGW